MFETLKATVCQITVFMICAQAIAHFRPREVYEKYLRMLLSVMILIQIFQPFCTLFFGVTGQELSATVAVFQQELDSSMTAAARQSALAAQKQENLSLLELQERIAEQKGAKQGEPEGQEETGGQAEPAVGGSASVEAAAPEEETKQIEQVGQIQIKTKISVPEVQGSQVTERQGD